MGLVAAGAPLELAEKPSRQLPLDFLVDAMNNEDLPIAARIDAAKAAAPFLHHRLGLLDSSGRDVPLQVTVLRFTDPETPDRRAEPEPVTIEHDPRPASH